MVELIIKSIHSPSIFGEVVALGIALLEGGNPIIQKSMFSKLLGGDLSQAFFKVFYDKMRDSQQEIKSTVTVNTSDIAAKADEDKQVCKDVTKMSGKYSIKTNGITISDELCEELNNAAEITCHAFATIRNMSATAEDGCSASAGAASAFEDMLAEKLEKHRERDEQNRLSTKVIYLADSTL